MTIHRIALASLTTVVLAVGGTVLTLAPVGAAPASAPRVAVPDPVTCAAATTTTEAAVTKARTAAVAA
ncbi:hypothetical protein, partial [Streptomyces sp. SID1121]|uniref:hypothetical protein n=1 Tax=Streptomyces sp. SID1121 TaxID=3425888 RepID=UPI0040570258